MSSSLIRNRAIDIAKAGDNAVVEPAHIFLACALLWPESLRSRPGSLERLSEEVNSEGKPRLVSVPRVSLRAERVLDQLDPFSEEVLLDLLSSYLAPEGSDPDSADSRQKTKRKKKVNNPVRNDGVGQDKECSIEPIAARSIEELLGELDALTGLRAVKNRVAELVNLQRVNRARISKGLEALGSGLNLVFLGEPGTGKTTVARLVAEIYGSLGLLERGHLVEVGRQDLVAQYVGQTAPKVQQAVETAFGGVLFIDEAYSLSQENSHSNDFGSEAVATLIQLMENNRDKLAVFVAGYERQMNTFLDSNPGLRSRFTNTLVFEGYTQDEMVEITLEMIRNLELKVSDQVIGALSDHYSKADYSGSAGNGRYARNLVDKMISNMANRLGAKSIFETVALSSFSEDDVPRPKIQQPAGLKLGFQPR